VISVNAPSHYAVADATRKLRAEYARKCDADLIEILDEGSEKWSMGNKYRISRFTEQYYQTVYVDGDVILLEGAPNLFEADEAYKFMFRDEMPVIKQNGSQQYINDLRDNARVFGLAKPPDFSPNAGVMVIPQGLTHLYHPPKVRMTKPHWCVDQYYLACEIVKQGMLSKVSFLGPEYHWMYIQQDFWKGLPDHKIIHLNGSTNGPYRLDLAKRICEGNFEYLEPPKGSWTPKWPELRTKRINH